MLRRATPRRNPMSEQRLDAAHNFNTPNISHLLCHDNNDGIEFYNNNDISLNRRRR